MTTPTQPQEALMPTITVPEPVALPDGYRLLDFEVPRFATQDRANAGVATLLAAEVLAPDLAVAVAAGFIASLAAEQVSPWPQYRRHFDNLLDEWDLVRCTAHVDTKGGLRFADGDYAIARRARSGAAGSLDVWSLRGAVEVRTYASRFEVVAL